MQQERRNLLIVFSSRNQNDKEVAAAPPQSTVHRKTDKHLDNNLMDGLLHCVSFYHHPHPTCVAIRLTTIEDQFMTPTPPPPHDKINLAIILRGSAFTFNAHILYYLSDPGSPSTSRLPTQRIHEPWQIYCHYTFARSAQP